MNIIKAEAKDIDIICSLYEQYFSYYASLQPDYYKEATANREFYIKLLGSDMDAIFLAWDENKPVGFCHVTQKQTPPIEFYVSHRFAVLLEMFVTSELRGSGIGGELMEAAKSWTKERELDYLELRVLQLNDFARRFYERQNFDVTAHTMRCMMN